LWENKRQQRGSAFLEVGLLSPLDKSEIRVQVPIHLVRMLTKLIFMILLMVGFLKLNLLRNSEKLKVFNSCEGGKNNDCLH